MRGASAAGVGVGMHSPHGPRQSPRPLPPCARAIRLRPANHMRTQHRSTMPHKRIWSPRPRTKLTPLTHSSYFLCGFARTRVFTPLPTALRVPRPASTNGRWPPGLRVYISSIHVKQQQTYPRYVYVHRSVMGAGLRVDAVVDFDAGEGGAPCVSLRAVGRHSACARRTATGLPVGLCRVICPHVASL